MEAIWTEIKSALREQLPDHTYRMWIEPLGMKQEADGCLTITCPNRLFKKRIQDQYMDRIVSSLSAAWGREPKVRVEVDHRPPSYDQPPGQIQLILPQVHDHPHMGRLFRKDFTFDQFVVGESNDFAYCAALSLASKKNNHQNTLCLISKTGLGKSHLAQAAGHHILSTFPQERVYYITAEDFTNEMVMAFRSGGIETFKRKYRDGCDVLLMEDIHYLTGKERTQVELALTLEFLVESNKKLIFSSCCLPAEIPKLDSKLRSCLAGGLISAIDPPDFSTRVRILKKKCRTNGQPVPEDVLLYLAGELTEDVRQLESGLLGVTAKSSLMGSPINLRLAESVVQNIVRTRKRITIDVIKRLVCRQFKISETDVVSPSRKQCFVWPRQIAMYLSRRYTDAPLQAIGKSYNRLHATALHAIAVVEKGIRENPATRKQVEYLCQKLEEGRGSGSTAV